MSTLAEALAALEAAIHASHFGGRHLSMTDAEADRWLAAAIFAAEPRLRLVTPDSLAAAFPEWIEDVLPIDWREAIAKATLAALAAEGGPA